MKKKNCIIENNLGEEEDSYFTNQSTWESSSLLCILKRTLAVLCCCHTPGNLTHPSSAWHIFKTEFAFPLQSLFIWPDCCVFPVTSVEGRMAGCGSPVLKQAVCYGLLTDVSFSLGTAPSFSQL